MSQAVVGAQGGGNFLPDDVHGVCGVLGREHPWEVGHEDRRVWGYEGMNIHIECI